MFDVFYTGTKPNLFVFEKSVNSIEDAAAQSRTEFFWYIYGRNDYTGFNFDYTPVPWEENFTHVWPDQHNIDGNVYLTKNPHADKCYHDEHKVHRLPNIDYFVVPDYIDQDSIDWRWSPNPNDPPYIYHFPSQHQSASGVTYSVPGATDTKLVDDFVVKALPYKLNWHTPGNIDSTSIDYSWHPNVLDPKYIYHFPSQHQSASGVTYSVPGASEIKLVDSFVVTALPNPESFESRFEIRKFDYSWHPNPLDTQLTYVWGNQWNSAVLEPTVIYNAGGAEIKYMDDSVVIAPKYDNHWRVLDTIEHFDYSWRPNPTEPPYIYVFGNQWMSPEIRPALEYHVAGATERKFMHEPKAQRRGNPEKFITYYDADFDYSWEPDPGSPPYIYVFGNQWYPAEVMPTVEYNVEGATERKFMSEPVAKLTPIMDNWVTVCEHNFDFDYSWRPEPGSPPYIYKFGNQWHDATIMPTVEYHVPGATEIKYMALPGAKLLENKTLWTIPEEVDTTNIDFSWVPDPGAPKYIYHFGTEYQVSVGLTYSVPGATEPRFEGTAPKIVKERSIVEVVDIFFMDRGNPTAQSRFDLLLEKYPRAQKIRYANSIMDTIRRCLTRAKTGKFWIISSEYNYDNFDFHWHAQPWQSYMTHVFSSQHNKWSDTFLINKWEFERHARWAKSLEEFPNLNFVQDQSVTKTENLWDIYYVDHGNPDSENQFKILRTEFPDIVKTRHANDYLSVLKRIMTTANTEYVWVINSVCNYDFFDFSWQPEPWQKEMIHCFSNSCGNWNEKRGDTFYIHVESFKTQMVELEMLDWFNVINYVVDCRVDRYPIPIVEYETDNLIEAIDDHEFTTPYALFANRDFASELGETIVDCLWTEKDRTVRPYSTSGAISLVPRDIKKYLKTQVYDYPYLYKYEDGLPYTYYADVPMDVVYISNGEPDAERWYEHLKSIVLRDSPVAATFPRFANKLHRVQNVNGRVAAYQAAAKASTSPWFFAVFAKLEVEQDFDFNWQPDYWQQPKHYIFNAKNPVNGLEYGHMGMIAYNKKLVMENNDPGIDFTLSQLHESVPILSGTAHYNQDAWTTWRTAFREVVKLKLYNDAAPTVETEYRLNKWLTVAAGDYSEYSKQGAEHAVEYYNQVNGNHEELMKSFEWDWLRQYFNTKYQTL